MEQAHYLLGKRGDCMSEEPLMNNESIKRIIHSNVCLGDELKRLRKEKDEYYRAEKEAMLKHITDLEVAYKKAVDMWEQETSLFDFELMIASTKEQFAYLFDIDTTSEMHSGPYHPDGNGYMDGDE